MGIPAQPAARGGSSLAAATAPAARLLGRPLRLGPPVRRRDRAVGLRDAALRGGGRDGVRRGDAAAGAAGGRTRVRVRAVRDGGRCGPLPKRRRGGPGAHLGRRHLPGQHLQPLRRAARRRPARRVLRRRPRARPRSRGVPRHGRPAGREPLARAVPAAGGSGGGDPADQGHGSGVTGPARARAVGQGPRRERDDRRPDAQRPRPRLRDRDGPRDVARRAGAGSGRPPPRLRGQGHADRRRDGRGPAACDVPARVGDRCAQGARDGGHPRARGDRARGVHRRDRLPEPGGRARDQRRHPDLRGRRAGLLDRRRRRDRGRLGARPGAGGGVHQGRPPARGRRCDPEHHRIPTTTARDGVTARGRPGRGPPPRPGARGVRHLAGP